MIEITRDNLSEIVNQLGSTLYEKLPIQVQAIQMNEDFVVETLEGKMMAYEGDYLIIGVEGEPYPCNREIFEKTYKQV